MSLVDLRSDTVTAPTAAMRRAMADAEVGDDVFGEDPTVHALEDHVAGLFGRESAMFVPSGVMATQVLLATLCDRGTEVVCEADAHVVAFEAGAASLIANVQFQTIFGDRGRLDAAQVSDRLRPAMFPYTQTSAISVEEPTNRGGGAIHGIGRVAALRALADDHGIVLHGDGARLFNAIVATGVAPEDYGRLFTGFSVCLSKGLGAPVGSVVVGDADVVDEARLWRRRLGGAMRQSGVVAAAGLHALQHNVARLAEDHEHARMIAERIADANAEAVNPETVETNIVYVATGARPATDVVTELAAEGVRVAAMGPRLIRLVTHLDVDTTACKRAADLLAVLVSR